MGTIKALGSITVYGGGGAGAAAPVFSPSCDYNSIDKSPSLDFNDTFDEGVWDFSD